VVNDPGILSPEKFIAEVITVRLPNPFLPDTPQRIAGDSSQKIPVRYGETLKAYIAKGMDLKNLRFIPLVLAAWPRYLMGIDDEGKPFTVSPDPRLGDLGPLLAGLKLGDKGPFHEILKPIFSDKRIFGVDLYEAGLGEKVEAIFAELLAGPGAVVTVLKEVFIIP
jgi:fructuronate reductase